MRRIREAVIGLGITAVLTAGAATPGGATDSPNTGRSWLQPSAQAGTRTIIVHPGQSIQRAVNRAHSGDTVLIAPGRYRQSVLVAKNNLRIRGSGAGPGGTVIQPAATPRGRCAKQASSGICVFDPHHKRTIVGTRVDNLRVRNFAGDGIVGVGTRDFVVANVTARNNARYGITRFDSTGGRFVNNLAIGSADAGIYIGDSPHANLRITGNEVRKNGFGILTRNAKHVSIRYNDAHANCIGIFVWWLPGAAGHSNIRSNTVRHNNKFCRGSDEIPFNYSGSGIALLGARDVVVADNSVLKNRGKTLVSGGIVLVSGKSDGGPASTGNVVRRNSAFMDSPADIVDHSDGRNVIRGNFCTRSLPKGMCRL